MPLPEGSSLSWKDLVAAALRESGGEADLRELYTLIRGHPKTSSNPTWDATIRWVVRQYNIFEPVQSGQGARYRLVEHEPLRPSPEEPLVVTGSEEDHGSVQGLLASLGQIYGYDTFILANDRSARQFNSVSLGNYATLETLDGMDGHNATKRRLEQIDVLWTVEDSDGAPWPRYAFEVEHTTGIRSGLERFLNVPDRFGTRLYIVAPGDPDRDRYRNYIQEPPFRSVATSVTFCDYAQVRDLYEAAARHDALRERLGFAYRT